MITTILLTIWILSVLFLFLVNAFFNSLWGENKSDTKTNIKIIFWPIYVLYRVLGGKK